MMLEQGVIKPWESPLYVIPKENGGLRPCGDYRALNARTIPDRYSPLHIEDFAQQLHGKWIFSKIDLIRTYYQIPEDPKFNSTRGHRKDSDRNPVRSIRSSKYHVRTLQRGTNISKIRRFSRNYARFRFCLRRFPDSLERREATLRTLANAV